MAPAVGLGGDTYLLLKGLYLLPTEKTRAIRTYSVTTRMGSFTTVLLAIMLAVRNHPSSGNFPNSATRTLWQGQSQPKGMLPPCGGNSHFGKGYFRVFIEKSK